MTALSLLFLGKADDPGCARALDHCRALFSPLTACLGRWGDPLPDGARRWSGDLIVSYLSRWVVPQELLDRARFAAINFHPASPEYPGIGCTNFALYDDAGEYGVTCHHMAARVDTGPIIAVRRFPVLPTDGVDELLRRTYEHQMILFLEIVELVVRGGALPTSAETWTRPPFTRREFERLLEIAPDMSRQEIARRVRATSYGPWQPHVDLGGFRFVYRPPGD